MSFSVLVNKSFFLNLNLKIKEESSKKIKWEKCIKIHNILDTLNIII